MKIKYNIMPMYRLDNVIANRLPTHVRNLEYVLMLYLNGSLNYLLPFTPIVTDNKIGYSLNNYHGIMFQHEKSYSRELSNNFTRSCIYLDIYSCYLFDCCNVFNQRIDYVKFKNYDSYINRNFKSIIRKRYSHVKCDAYYIISNSLNVECIIFIDKRVDSIYWEIYLNPIYEHRVNVRKHIDNIMTNF